jgi:hypothetical protein
VPQRPVAIDVAADVLGHEADARDLRAVQAFATEAQQRLVGAIAPDAEVERLVAAPELLELVLPRVVVADFVAVGERLAEARQAHDALGRLFGVLAVRTRPERVIGERERRTRIRAAPLDVAPAEFGVELRDDAGRLTALEFRVLRVEPEPLPRMADRAEGRDRAPTERAVAQHEQRHRDVGDDQ